MISQITILRLLIPVLHVHELASTPSIQSHRHRPAPVTPSGEVQKLLAAEVVCSVPLELFLPIAVFLDPFEHRSLQVRIFSVEELAKPVLVFVLDAEVLRIFEPFFVVGRVSAGPPVFDIESMRCEKLVHSGG